MTKIYDVIKFNNNLYAVDNIFPIGDKFLGISERENVLGTIKSFGRLDDTLPFHVNGSWNTAWYHPSTPLGVFHIVATTVTIGLPLLPAIEEDIEALANNVWDENHLSERLAFKQGYKAGKAKRYTEEDISNAMFHAAKIGQRRKPKGKVPIVVGREMYDLPIYQDEIDEYLQSLNSVPKQVVLEIDGMDSGLIIEKGFVKVKQWIYGSS